MGALIDVDVGDDDTKDVSLIRLFAVAITFNARLFLRVASGSE